MQECAGGAAANAGKWGCSYVCVCVCVDEFAMQSNNGHMGMQGALSKSTWCAW